MSDEVYESEYIRSTHEPLPISEQLDNAHRAMRLIAAQRDTAETDLEEERAKIARVRKEVAWIRALAQENLDYGVLVESLEIGRIRMECAEMLEAALASDALWI